MMIPICVLHIIDGLAPGGTERVLIDLVNGLARRNISVGVCVTRSCRDLASELDPGIELLVLDRVFTWDIKPIARLARYCLTRGVRIIHAHTRSSFKFAALIKLLCGGRPSLIFHDHFGEIHIDRSVSTSMRWASQGFADWYLAVSPELQDWAVGKLGFPLARTTVLGNALDRGRFNLAITPAKLDVVSQPLKAVMIANLRPQKDHRFLLHAFSASALARNQLHLYFVGLDLDDAYSQEIHNLVHELQLESNISFLGTRTDIPSILQSVDFGLLSSQSESGPVVLLEYMAAGLPFLATDTGQIVSLLAGAGLPYFVEPGNIEAYAECLDSLVSLTDEQKQALAFQENQLLHTFFDIRHRVDVLVNIYQSLGLNNHVEA